MNQNQPVSFVYIMSKTNSSSSVSSFGNQSGIDARSCSGNNSVECISVAG